MRLIYSFYLPLQPKLSFHGYNSDMSLRRNTRKKPLRDFAVREKVASWLLLAAFLPMLVLSSLHTHSPQSRAAVAASYQQAAQDECSECVRHLPHAGHFTTATTPLHPCVFCQFLSLTYLFVAVATIIKHTIKAFSPSINYRQTLR